MGIRKRTNGIWHYQFVVNGKRHTGTTGETDRRKAASVAKKIETRLRFGAHVEDLASLQPDYSSSRGDMLPLDATWEAFLAKPNRNRTSADRMKATESRWIDFLAFLEYQCKVPNLYYVTPDMAEAYVSHLQEHGRYGNEAAKPLSAATINDFIVTCRMVCDRLHVDPNPFQDIPKIKAQHVAREPFTIQELAKILNYLRDDQNEHPGMYELFLIGASTGLREGDICTLRWGDVDLGQRCITKVTNKTKQVVRIPMTQALHDFLTIKYMHRAGLALDPQEYVIPLMAFAYLSTSRSAIGKEVSAMLDKLGIESTRTVPGYARKVSVKDIHSLRHTFVYMAAMNGVPLPVVQSIVGHGDSAMTRRYMEHVNDEDRLRYANMLGNLSIASDEPEATDRRATEFDSLRLHDSTVNTILRAGGTTEDCAVALSAENKVLRERIIALEHIAPRRSIMPDGSDRVWRCPRELIPVVD